MGVKPRRSRRDTAGIPQRQSCRSVRGRR
jgi:hypothetical protein